MFRLTYSGEKFNEMFGQGGGGQVDSRFLRKVVFRRQLQTEGFERGSHSLIFVPFT